MANKDDYLTEYRQFFEEFANTVEPNDQLPVKLGSYKFINSEVVGGIVDWCLQYLNRKSCPSTLIGPLIKITIDEIRMTCKKHPVACGFNPSEKVYEPLKLMQSVMSKMNEICLRYLDNSELDKLPAPATVPPPLVSVSSTRNTRRRMEDRHVVIHDLNSVFNIQDTGPSSYYAIFDGHAGQDAASYSAAHLHQFLVESEFYPTDPERAFKEAFLRTDEFFLEKSKIENFRSGTTAVCGLLRPKQKTLYVAWVGDSQALLVNRGKVLQIVKPHKPSRQDEKDRIEANGGCVMFWGMWRVNGQLAVSRAIGNLKLKPYVTADPDITSVPLDGNEEFLIMACDGLWDFVSEDDAAIAVYNRIRENPDNISTLAEHLVDLAKQEGSRDNISVIIILLKDPQKIAKKLSTDWGWSGRTASGDAAMDTSVDNSNTTTNNTAANNAFDLFDVYQKHGPILENCAADFRPNGTTENKNSNSNSNSNSDLFYLERPTNGKRSADEFDEEEDDFGPETDVDAIDDELLSSITSAKAIAEGIVNNNPLDEVDKMDNLDVDLELQRQQSSEFEPAREPREETPTPPADSVLDSSGLADNVAESGEDSEDEWNYYRVDPKQKDSNVPATETNNKVSSDRESEGEESEEMSQLNPDAKEFVPVSPTRNVNVSPLPNYNRDVVDDMLVAQSPRRAVPMDINVPSPVEFQHEVKQRPSDVFEELNSSNSEWHDNQNGHQLSSQEIMQNLLNGKDVSEIEFRPSALPKSDNHLIDSSTDVATNNEVNEAFISKENKEVKLSADSPEFIMKDDTTDFASFVPKPQDPMSMSFYQDRDEEVGGFSTNPFDLNKVQMLPDDIDDDSQESGANKKEMKSPIKDSSPAPLSVSPGAKSPLGEAPKSPKSPLSEDGSRDGNATPTSPEPIQVCPPSKSPEELRQTAKSPGGLLEPCEDLSKFPTGFCKSPLQVDVSEVAKSPILDVHSPMELSSPAGPLSPKSPIPELTGLVSPDITASIKDENISVEISDTPKSPMQNQTPIDDGLKSPVTQELENEVKSPLEVGENLLEPAQVAHLSVGPSPGIGHSPEVCQSPGGLSKSPETVCKSPEEISRSPDEICKSPGAISKSPEIIAKSPRTISRSPEAICRSPGAISKSPEPLAKSPLNAESPEPLAKSPLVAESPEHLAKSPLIAESPELLTKSSLVAESPVSSPLDLVEPTVQKEPSQYLHPLEETPLSPENSPIPTEDLEFPTEEPESFTNLTETLTDVVEQSRNLVDFLSKEAELSADAVICEMNKEAKDVQQLISDAIADVTVPSDLLDQKPKFLEATSLFGTSKSPVEDSRIDLPETASPFGFSKSPIGGDIIGNNRAEFLEASSPFEGSKSPLGGLTEDNQSQKSEVVNLMEEALDACSIIKKEVSNVNDVLNTLRQEVSGVIDACGLGESQIQDSPLVEEKAQPDGLLTKPLEPTDIEPTVESSDRNLEIEKDLLGLHTKHVEEEPLEAVEPQPGLQQQAKLYQIPSDSNLPQDELFTTNLSGSENAPSEIGSFLDRSTVPEVTSPLSPPEDSLEAEKFRPELWRCVFPLPPEYQAPVEIKCETIRPEFPDHIIASPCEESKGTDTPPPTPAVVHTEPEMQRGISAPEVVEIGALVESQLTVDEPAVAKMTATEPTAPKMAEVPTDSEVASKEPEISLPILEEPKALIVSQPTAEEPTVPKLPEEPTDSEQTSEISQPTIEEPKASEPILEESKPSESTAEGPPVPKTAAILAAATGIVAATGAVAATSLAAKPSKPKPSATAAAKRPAAPKSTPSSPTKPLPARPASSTARRSTPSAPSAAKPTPSKPTTLKSTRPPTSTTPKLPTTPRTPATPKTRTPATTPTYKTAMDKKPLMNGDVKAPLRQSLVKKTTLATAAAPKTAATRTSTTTVTKSAASKTATTTTSKPTATTRSPAAAAAAKPAGTTTAAPKPRPATFTFRTTSATSATATKTATTKPASTFGATKSAPNVTARPRPATTTTLSKPRSALTATKTAAKPPDTEKQLKETVNKQLSASRTTTTRTTALTSKTTTSTTKKIDSKAPVSNRTTTKTATTTLKSCGKKPTEVTRTTVTKSKNPVAKGNVDQNGVVDVIQQITTVTMVGGGDSDLKLLKDNSPVDLTPSLVDNSKLPLTEINAD